MDYSLGKMPVQQLMGRRVTDALVLYTQPFKYWYTTIHIWLVLKQM